MLSGFLEPSYSTSFPSVPGQRLLECTIMSRRHLSTSAVRPWSFNHKLLTEAQTREGGTRETPARAWIGWLCLGDRVMIPCVDAVWIRGAVRGLKNGMELLGKGPAPTRSVLERCAGCECVCVCGTAGMNAYFLQVEV